MTTVQTGTALDRFVKKTREFFARETDPEKRWTMLDPILAELLSDPQVIEASKTWPECQFVNHRIENLLFYEDPYYKFVVNGLILHASSIGYSPTTPTRIHDHAHIYTLYGLLDGHQRIVRYERLDDGTKPDYAEIRTTTNSDCGPGEIDLVRPFEIHSEDQLGERAVALIIRSEMSGGFLQGHYHPERNGYSQGYGPRQTPMSIV